MSLKLQMCYMRASPRDAEAQGKSSFRTATQSAEGDGCTGAAFQDDTAIQSMYVAQTEPSMYTQPAHDGE